MKMNKEIIINKLIEKTSLSNEECSIIYEVLKNHSIIGRKNKEKIKVDFIEKLNVSEDVADKIYNISMELVLNDFFNKLKK